MMNTSIPVEWNENESVSHTLVTAVADVADCDLMELDPLYRYIDPDALDTIFHHPSTGKGEQTGVTLEFTYMTYQVKVTTEYVHISSLE